MATIAGRPSPTGSAPAWDEIDRLCIQTVRCLAIDAVEAAGSGHPGLPLGAAPMAYVLFSRFLRHCPTDPEWPDRDRFVLSAGHGSMLLYALLHLSGYGVELDDLRRFRQWGSKTPGHPELQLTPGVEATTGPLGQGLANAVGMAIAERTLASRFNRLEHQVVDHRTFALVSDGDLMEGVALEAVSLAGHLRLGRLLCLYDSNHVSLDGPTRQAFTEDVGARFAACGWQVLRVEDGDHDLEAIASAIRAGLDDPRPTLVEVRTTIGYGSPHKAGTAAAHGAPLGTEEARLTKLALGWSAAGDFAVPDVVRDRFDRLRRQGERLRSLWNTKLSSYADEHPELVAEWRRRVRGEVPPGWDDGLDRFPEGEQVATRQASGTCLQLLAERVPELVGGDADLSSSTNTRIGNGGDFQAESRAGRNLHFGVREHAMGAICNGIAYHGGLRPYAATFFVFSDYMRPAIRLAAMNRLPVIFVFTHDSIGLGEDGPTHQPVEQLASLRAMPNLMVVRPADANETAVGWRIAVARRDGPTALVLSRQKLPVLGTAGTGAERGAYVLAEASGHGPRVILMASGSEVHLALEGRRCLEAAGIATRVVSFPCWQLFEAQPAAYRESVLPARVRARVAVEAAASLGWERYVGDAGQVVGLDRFGASSPGPQLLEELGFTPQAVVRAARRALSSPVGGGGEEPLARVPASNRKEATVR